jgi:hypothetical protein
MSPMEMTLMRTTRLRAVLLVMLPPCSPPMCPRSC